MSEEKKISPVSFVDKTQDKKSKSPISFVNDVETKKFVILYYALIDDKEIKSFEVTTGRTATREWLKEYAPYLDLNASKVLAEGLSYDLSASVYEYMKAMEEYFEDGFDIEDYVGGYEI